MTVTSAEADRDAHVAAEEQPGVRDVAIVTTHRPESPESRSHDIPVDIATDSTSYMPVLPTPHGISVSLPPDPNLQTQQQPLSQLDPAAAHRQPPTASYDGAVVQAAGIAALEQQSADVMLSQHGHGERFTCTPVEDFAPVLQTAPATSTQAAGVPAEPTAPPAGILASRGHLEGFAGAGASSHFATADVAPYAEAAPARVAYTAAALALSAYSTLVIDSGSGTVRAGFAGDASPKRVLPTAVSRVRDRSVWAGGWGHRGGMPTWAVGSMPIDTNARVGLVTESRGGERYDVCCPVEQGVVTNWDAMENIWRE